MILWTKIKNWINLKTEESIFGEMFYVLKSLYERNISAFYIQLAVSALLSIYISGYLCLGILNIGGHRYNPDLYNIFIAFLKYGIVPAIALFLGIQLVIFRFIQKYSSSYISDKNRNYEKSKKGTYGTASEMTREEMERTFNIAPLKDNPGTIFGKDPNNLHNVVTQKNSLLKINRNVLMIAGPSAGKSATFVLPLLLQIMRRGESAIVSDPKSELFAITSELAKYLGYEMRILNLNPMFLKNSDPWNAMKYVGDDPDKAQVISNAIITTQTAAGDIFDFWTEGPLNLLQAIILRINIGDDYQENEKHLPQLFTYVTTHTLEEMENDFEMLPEGHLAKAPFQIFKNGDEKPKKQVLQGLAIKLKLFNSPKLYKILSETKGDIDVLNPGRKRCIYFVGSNDQDSSMQPILSLFYTILYQELVRYADTRRDRQLPVTVHMVLDEYANIGKIPDFEKKLSTVRSRNIVTYIIIQDINQLKEKHPGETWRTVVNDCDYHMCLKTNDIPTMEWWSDMTGEGTVAVINKRYHRDKMQLSNSHIEEDHTEGLGKRNTYTKHEVRTLKDDEVLVLVSQRNVVKLKTFFWKTDHPYAKFVNEILPVQHYPFWKLIEDGIVDETFDYDHELSYIMPLPEDELVEIEEDYDPDKMLNAFNKLKKKKQIPSILVKNKEQKEEPEEQVHIRKPIIVEAGINSQHEGEEKKSTPKTNTIGSKKSAQTEYNPLISSIKTISSVTVEQTKETNHTSPEKQQPSIQKTKLGQQENSTKDDFTPSVQAFLSDKVNFFDDAEEM